MALEYKLRDEENNVSTVFLLATPRPPLQPLTVGPVEVKTPLTGHTSLSCRESTRPSGDASSTSGRPPPPRRPRPSSPSVPRGVLARTPDTVPVGKNVPIDCQTHTGQHLVTECLKVRSGVTLTPCCVPVTLRPLVVVPRSAVQIPVAVRPPLSPFTVTQGRTPPSSPFESQMTLVPLSLMTFGHSIPPSW